MTDLVVPGTTLQVPYPFVRETVTLPGEDGKGLREVESYRPGTLVDEVEAIYGTHKLYANAMGAMLLTVISLHRKAREAPPFRAGRMSKGQHGSRGIRRAAAAD